MNFITIEDKENLYTERLKFANYKELIDVKCSIKELEKIINEYNIQNKFDYFYRNGIEPKELMQKIEKHKSKLEKLKIELVQEFEI